MVMCRLLSLDTAGYLDRNCLHCSWYLGTYGTPMSGMSMVGRLPAKTLDNLHLLDPHFHIVGGIVSQTKTNLDLLLLASCIGCRPVGCTFFDWTHMA